MRKRKKIDQEVDHILETLAGLTPGTEEYARASDDLKVVCEARSFKPGSTLDWNTVLGVAGGLAQILVIITHERMNVIATKAISFVTKARF